MGRSKFIFDFDFLPQPNLTIVPLMELFKDIKSWFARASWTSMSVTWRNATPEKNNAEPDLKVNTLKNNKPCRPVSHEYNQIKYNCVCGLLKKRGLVNILSNDKKTQKHSKPQRRCYCAPYWLYAACRMFPLYYFYSFYPPNYLWYTYLCVWNTGEWCAFCSSIHNSIMFHPRT